MKKLAVLLLLVILVSAEDYVVVNSKDGRDVLSGIFYANVKNVSVAFLPLNGDPELLAAKVGRGHDVLLIESEALPVSGFLEAALRARGNAVTVQKSGDPAESNLELGRQSGAQQFIVVDSAFADNALSALPYAAHTGSYVVFADKGNADTVKESVTGSIILFGYLDPEAREALAEFHPETIGNGNDKFEDNIAMVERTLAIIDSKQVWVTDGTFIEEGMVHGDFPILLSGRLTPQPTYAFVKRSTREDSVRVYVLIGTELATPFHDTRDRVKNELAAEGIDRTFGILIKFGQAVPRAGGDTNGLVTFPLPTYIPSMEIREINYNDATGQLELVVRNTGDGPVFFRSEIRIKVNGEEKNIIVDPVPLSLSRGETRGTEYAFAFPNIEEGSVSADVVTRYGASTGSLGQFAVFSSVINEISFTDHSNATATAAKYDAANRVLRITFRNTGETDVFVNANAELLLDGVPTTITSEKVFRILPNGLYVHEIPLALSDSDLQQNEQLTLHMQYGGREGFLQQRRSVVLPLEYEQFDWLWLVAGVAVLVFAGAVYLRQRGKKK